MKVHVVVGRGEKSLLLVTLDVCYDIIEMALFGCNVFCFLSDVAP